MTEASNSGHAARRDGRERWMIKGPIYHPRILGAVGGAILGSLLALFVVILIVLFTPPLPSHYPHALAVYVVFGVLVTLGTIAGAVVLPTRVK
jgi:hypothetical protein